MPAERSLVLNPIGYIETPFESKYDAPHQPGGHDVRERGIITLLPHQNFEQALEDLEGIEKIWLIYWFDRNANWKPKVLVPRGENKKRGLFATRSPHRPNPIGLSLVDLIAVNGLTLVVDGVDLLNGTPILDIKPYLPYLESAPEAKAGWIDEANALDNAPAYRVKYSELAREQLDFLSTIGIHLEERVERILSRDPTQHPYKRIEKIGDDFVFAVREWRVQFSVEAKTVTIDRIESGNKQEHSNSEIAPIEKEFQARWPARISPESSTP